MILFLSLAHAAKKYRMLPLPGTPAAARVLASKDANGEGHHVNVPAQAPCYLTTVTSHCKPGDVRSSVGDSNPPPAASPQSAQHTRCSPPLITSQILFACCTTSMPLAKSRPHQTSQTFWWTGRCGKHGAQAGPLSGSTASKRPVKGMLSPGSTAPSRFTMPSPALGHMPHHPCRLFDDRNTQFRQRLGPAAASPATLMPYLRSINATHLAQLLLAASIRAAGGGQLIKLGSMSFEERQELVEAGKQSTYQDWLEQQFSNGNADDDVSAQLQLLAEQN